MNYADDIKQYSDELNELGIRHEILQHPDLRTPPEVQAYLRLTLADGLSTMVMKTAKGFIATIRRCDTKLDSKKIKALVGSKLRMATAEELQRITGLPVGAARVLLPGLPVYLDKQLTDKDWLVGGSGRFDHSIRYRSHDLMLLPDSSIADISQ